MRLDHGLDGLEVHAGVLADGGVRAAARLDAHNAVGRQDGVGAQKLGVLFGVDIVGHDAQRILARHLAGKGLYQGSLARAHGAGNTDTHIRH